MDAWTLWTRGRFGAGGRFGRTMSLYTSPITARMCTARPMRTPHAPFGCGRLLPPSLHTSSHPSPNSASGFGIRRTRSGRRGKSDRWARRRTQRREHARRRLRPSPPPPPVRTGRGPRCRRPGPGRRECRRLDSGKPLSASSSPTWGVATFMKSEGIMFPFNLVFKAWLSCTGQSGS